MNFRLWTAVVTQNRHVERHSALLRHTGGGEVVDLTQAP
jgi:hypothetical protein